jgi:hypothetical protein
MIRDASTGCFYYRAREPPADLDRPRSSGHLKAGSVGQVDGQIDLAISGLALDDDRIARAHQDKLTGLNRIRCSTTLFRHHADCLSIPRLNTGFTARVLDRNFTTGSQQKRFNSYGASLRGSD